MLKYIVASLGVLFVFTYYADPVDTPEPEVKQVIKLTTRHLPIHRYFAEDDDEDTLTVSQQYMIVRRDTVVKAQVDVRPTEDDVAISDGVKLRLLLVRMQAIEKYKEIHKG